MGSMVLKEFILEEQYWKMFREKYKPIFHFRNQMMKN
jgi:hypothetical protein